ncbi:hypothetical protein GCM10007096_22480 [Pullulanibacillus pueri]|uniref:Uncharacterized protein n=1 Tax=Pullulanibacillus pueri TaxID=1437324 RepID=A0A8J2ZW17_9BACL|nr:hypothetical protein GCM10007096_22480 [Pullulanibacillus pueri]
MCSDSNNSKLYVPTFKNNDSKMKLGGPKSHGESFIYNGKIVTMWGVVEDTLMKYKSSFCDGEVQGWADSLITVKQYTSPTPIWK